MSFSPKTWLNRPLEPNDGETLEDYEDRLAAYAAANPTLVTPLDAAGLNELEGRVAGAFVAAGSTWVVADLQSANTAAQNAAALQAALDTASALSANGGTVYVPDGTYAMPEGGGWVTMPSNVTLWMGARCELDFSGATVADGNNTLFNISGTEVGYTDAAWQMLTANVLLTDRSLAIPDSSQFAVGDYVRLGTTEVFDPGSRNGFGGEIVKVTAVPDSTHLTLEAGPCMNYYARTHVNATPSTVATGGITNVVTTIPVVDATRYRKPTQYKHGRVQIDTEEITYLWRDELNLYGCQRGVRGTTAASHLAAATVTELPPVAIVSGAHTSGATTITLVADAGVNGGINQLGEPSDAGYGAVTNGFVRVQRTGELIYYRTKSGNTLTNCIRGFEGSTAAALVDTDVIEEIDGAWVAKMNLASDVTIRGGRIVGPEIPASENSWIVGIYADKTARLRVEGVKFQNVKTMSVVLYDCIEPVVTGCHSEGSNRNNYGYGVVVGWSTQDGIISENQFVRPRHAVSHGASISNSRYSVTGDTKIGAGVPRRMMIRNNVSIASTGQSFDCHSGADDISFIGNHSYNTTGNGGFWINSPSATIQGNTVINPEGSGIFAQNLTPHPTAWRISDNVFSGGTGVYHIQISIDGTAGRPSAGAYSRCIIISNNEFNDAWRYAISLGGASSTSGGTRWTSGIYVNGINVTNNVINRAGWGIVTNATIFTNMDGAVIAGNQFYGSRQASLNITGLRGGVVSGNTIESTPGHTWTGIALVSVVDSVIEGNVVRNETTGLSLDNNCTYCIVGFNQLRNNTTPLSLGTGTGHIRKTTDGLVAGDYNRL